MNTEIRWQPPQGYSVVDSTPKSLGTVYCHQTHLAFAFLKKNKAHHHHNPHHHHHHHHHSTPATIVGSLGGHEELQIPVTEAALPPLTPSQMSELASILVQVGKWCKLDELEIARLLSVSRKNSTEDEEEEEPKAKRPRLNGGGGVTFGGGAGANNNNSPLLPPGDIQNALLKLSLESGILCPFTFFKGTATDGRQLVQALPYNNHNKQHTNHHHHRNGVVSNQKKNDMRRRVNHRRWHNGTILGPAREFQEHQGVSMAASLAKSTISAVSSSFMNFVNLFHSDTSSIMEGGKTIDDEVELQSRRGTQLFWDESHGEIKYPAMYYQASKSSSSSDGGGSSHHCHSSKHKSAKLAGSHHHKHQSTTTTNGHCRLGTRLDIQTTPPSCTPYRSSSIPAQRYFLDTSSSSDDEEENLAISDSESDSSVELDWESLPKTREYLPMIQMQLFSGAWPMAHEFSYAVRVPQSEINKLPLSQQSVATSATTESAAAVQKNCLRDLDNEADAHFWTTALAVVCFRECFPEFENEWELIVHKGEHWIEQNLHLCALSKDEVHSIAKELLFRKS